MYKAKTVFDSTWSVTSEVGCHDICVPVLKSIHRVAAAWTPYLFVFNWTVYIWRTIYLVTEVSWQRYVTRSLSIEYTTTRHKVREIFSLGAQQLILTCKRILLSSMSHAVSHFEMICIIETTYCTSRWCWRLHDSWQMMTLQWLRNRHNRSHLAVTVYFKSSFYIKISA